MSFIDALRTWGPVLRPCCSRSRCVRHCGRRLRQLRVPSFTGDHVDTALFAAFCLCVGVSPAPPPSHYPAPPPRAGAAAAPGTPEELATLAKRVAPDFAYHHPTAVEAAAWVAALMREWDDRVRTELLQCGHGPVPWLCFGQGCDGLRGNSISPAASLPASNY